MGSKTEIIKLIDKLPDAEKDNALQYIKEISRKYENSNDAEDAGESTDKKEMTCANILNSDLVGIWKDRKDIKDSVKFINEIRSKMSRRD